MSAMFGVIGFANMTLAFLCFMSDNYKDAAMLALGCVFWSLMSIRQVIADKRVKP